MSKKISLLKSHSYFGLFVAILEDTTINFGGKLIFDSEKGFNIEVVVEEFNQKHDALHNKDYIEKCEAYLIDDKENSRHCTLYNVVLSTKYHSSIESSNALRFYPQICLFNTYRNKIEINAVILHFPFWNDFFYPKSLTKEQRYSNRVEQFQLNNGWKIEFKENATYNLVNSKNIDGIFIDLDERIQIPEDVKYLKHKVGHDHYVVLLPEKHLCDRYNDFGQIIKEINVFRNFLSILFHMKINIENIVLHTTDDAYINTLMDIRNINKMHQRYEQMHHHMMPLTHSKIDNFAEIIPKFYDQYAMYEAIIEIIVQSYEEDFSKYQYTRIADSLKELGLKYDEKQPYNSIITAIANNEIQKEIKSIFKQQFNVDDWGAIGVKISSLRGLITHFNGEEDDDTFCLLHNLTQIFKIIINSYFLRELGVDEKLTDTYQTHHFHYRTTIEMMYRDE